MLNQSIRKADKQPIKLIIISTIFLLSCFPSYSQNNPADTAAFKKDFEKLLSKYGISSKGYFININSINQSGGQTAFVITNNYYGDSILDISNFLFSVSNGVLTVSPKKGIWSSPFVATDSLKSARNFFDPGVGVSAVGHGMGAFIENKEYVLLSIIRSSPCSKRFPIYINMNPKDPDEFYIFGDMQDINKTYLYYKGQVSWFPIKEE